MTPFPPPESPRRAGQALRLTIEPSEGTPIRHPCSRVTRQMQALSLQSGMRISCPIGAVALSILSAFMTPQVSAQSPRSSLPAAPQSLVSRGQPARASGLAGAPLTPAKHPFWDRTNILLFSGVAASRTMDYVSTKNMLARGREEMLIPDDVVYSGAGFPGLEAAATATSVGLSYLLHRRGHHTLERWLSMDHIGVTDFGVARNYLLKSRHR